MTIYWAGAIAVLYGLGLLSLCWNFWRAIRLVQVQPRFDAGASSDVTLPRLDVVIPVKDEAADIATCIDSVLAQDYPNFRVTVVNDRSTDGTADVIEGIARRDPRVRIVHVRELPAGLYGKPHALSTVQSGLTADVIAFVDSDFRLRPHCLRSLVSHLLSSRLDLLAAMGTPELKYFWERLLVPLFGAVTFAWYDPRAIRDPNRPEAIGSGFMIARRAAYETLGGHNMVTKEYDEDSALVRLAKRAGQRVSYEITRGLFTVRFYGGLNKTVHGMTRTFVGGIKTLPRMFVTINALNFVSLLPLEILIGLGVARRLGAAVMWTPLWVGMACFHLVLTFAICWLIYDRAQGVRWLSFLHPLSVVMMIGVCLRATVGMVRGGPLTWRGTTY